MKLKTLKDLPFVKKAMGGENIRKEIKAEAVKWVKMLQDRIARGIAYNFEKSKIEWTAQIDILRIFFNIAGDELKEVER